MSVNVIGLLAALYGVVYLILASGSISRIIAVDPAYKERWGDVKSSWRRPGSFAVLYVMFNMNLPKAEYPESLQWRIWIARIMLWLWPVVMVLVVLFSPHR